MNKKLGLKVLIQNPFAVIMEGVRVRQQEYFKKKAIREYNIEQFPTVDLLDLFQNLNENIDTYSFLAGTFLINDLILLKLFAKKFQNCFYFEICSWRGESLVKLFDVND